MLQHINKEQAWQKIKHYCAYQERSHSEVKNKLYGFGLYKGEVEELLSKAIEEDYLNEERFAEMFAGGKFRMKHWGKVKIVYELRQKGVSSYNLNRALKAIPDEDYRKTLQKLAEEKWKSLKGEHPLSRQAKVISYLQQKGYEFPLIQQTLQGIRKGETAD